MVNANAVAAFRFIFLYLGASFAAVDLATFLNSQYGGAGSTTRGEAAPLHDSEAKVLLPLAAVVVVVLFAAVALIYHHLMTMGRLVVAGGGAGNGRLSTSGLLIFVLCVSAGTLEFVVFGHAAAGGGGVGHGARLLGLAALRALPAAATVTFFCGMLLIIVAVHVRAGGKAGGTSGVAGNGPIQGLLRVLPKVAAGLAAALVALMAMAVTFCGAK